MIGLRFTIYDLNYMILYQILLSNKIGMTRQKNLNKTIFYLDGI